MNLQPGIFGRKLGNTQLFEEDGTVTRVTVIEAGPVVVLGKRTLEKDGYIALILGLGEREERHTTKPMAGYFKKAACHPEARRQRAPMRRRVRRQVGGRADPQAGRDLSAWDARRRAWHVARPRLHRCRSPMGIRRRGHDARHPRVPPSRWVHRYEHDAGAYAAESQDARPIRQRDHLDPQLEGRPGRRREASDHGRRRRAGRAQRLRSSPTGREGVEESPPSANANRSRGDRIAAIVRKWRFAPRAAGAGVA